MKTTNEYITVEMVEDLPSIEGYEVHTDSMSGTTMWDTEKGNVTIMATPHWDKDGEVPVALYFTDGKSDEYVNLFTFTLEGTLAMQLRKYTQMIELAIHYIQKFK
jgi:hypothetical protein